MKCCELANDAWLKSNIGPRLLVCAARGDDVGARSVIQSAAHSR